MPGPDARRSPDRVERPGGDGPARADLDRRGFLTRSAAAAVIAALGGSCAPSPTEVRLLSEVTVDLADYPELAQVDGVARVQGTNVPVALVNLGPGDYAALSLVCPHQGGAISWRGTAFVCSGHGATFADDGHWIGGQPTGHMREYTTTYDAVSGTVTISP